MAGFHIVCFSIVHFDKENKCRSETDYAISHCLSFSLYQFVTFATYLIYTLLILSNCFWQQQIQISNTQIKLLRTKYKIKTEKNECGKLFDKIFFLERFHPVSNALNIQLNMENYQDVGKHG